MKIFIFILILIWALAILAILAIILNKHLPIWACTIMEWHLAPNKIGFNGCSQNGICPRCKIEVMRDSQGNWF